MSPPPSPPQAHGDDRGGGVNKDWHGGRDGVHYGDEGMAPVLGGRGGQGNGSGRQDHDSEDDDDDDDHDLDKVRLSLCS